MFLLLQCPCCYKLLVSIVLSPGNLPPSFQPPKASPSHHLPSCPPRAFSFLLKHPILQSFPFCLQDSSDTFPKTKAQLLSKNKNIWRKAPCSWEQPASRTRLKAGRAVPPALPKMDTGAAPAASHSTVLDWGQKKLRDLGHNQSLICTTIYRTYYFLKWEELLATAEVVLEMIRGIKALLFQNTGAQVILELAWCHL